MKLAAVLLLLYVINIQAQSYEDARCKCVCPNPSVVNVTQSNRKLYIENVPPNQCTCDNVILPRVGDEIKGKEKEFCPRCECKYESRNTSIIKYVVIIVIWIISLLVIYMLFLICLDPLLNKRMKGNYQEHTNEEVEQHIQGPGHGRGGSFLQMKMKLCHYFQSLLKIHHSNNVIKV